MNDDDEDNATSSDGSYNSEDDASDDEFKFPDKYKSIINHPTDNYDYEEQLENEKIKFYED